MNLILETFSTWYTSQIFCIYNVLEQRQNNDDNKKMQCTNELDHQTIFIPNYMRTSYTEQ